MKSDHHHKMDHVKEEAEANKIPRKRRNDDTL
jgi:hypothetical protein